MKTRYFLARYGGIGWPQAEDGPHDSPAGVAKAKALMKELFEDDGPWVMLTVKSIPNVEVQLDEDAADACAAMIQRGK